MPFDLRLWLLFAAAAVPRLADTPPPQHDLDNNAVIFEASMPPRRHLLGDWQGQDALLVAFDRTWESALDTMLTSAPATTRILLALERGTHPAEAARWLNDRGLDAHRYEMIEAELDSPWVRDFAPFQAVESDGRRVWIDAVYGSDRPHDDALPRHLSRHWGVARVDLPERLDGGAIVSNGEGLCVSTIEAFEQGGINSTASSPVPSLLDELGCHVMALVPALINDKTKHADMFMQFVAADRVVVASFDHAVDPEDSWRMDVAVAALHAGAARLGQSLEITRVPLVISTDGLYASFINGLRLGDRFLVPTFEFVADRDQERAFTALRWAMPGVELVPVAADSMIPLNGALHCLGVGMALPEHQPGVRSARLRPRGGFRGTGEATARPVRMR